MKPEKDERDAEIERLNAHLNFLHKWIERGLYDAAIGPKDALETMAHYPSSRFKTGEWDVDHKPYSERLYATFPGARPKKTPSIRLTKLERELLLILAEATPGYVACDGTYRKPAHSLEKKLLASWKGTSYGSSFWAVTDLGTRVANDLRGIAT